MLTGPDCSRHQGAVDWGKVAGAGHDFAIIKATDGVSYRYVDWFTSNFPRVKATGLVPGAYHFISAHHPGADQARYFVATVGDLDGVLAVVDVETGADGSHPTAARVREFATEFERLAPGHPLIVYTGRWYWRDILGNPYGADIGPLWHSEYDTGAEVTDGPEMDSYGGWSACTIWQYTSSGSCPGVAGNCDLNQFFGDRADLLALTGGDMPLSSTDLNAIKGAVNEATADDHKLLADINHQVFKVLVPAVGAIKAAVTGFTGADVDEAKLAAELAPLLPDQMHALSDADVARIAEAAADENARRQAE